MKEIDEAFFDLPSNRTQRSKNTLSNEPDLPSNSTVKNKNKGRLNSYQTRNKNIIYIRPSKHNKDL